MSTAKQCNQCFDFKPLAEFRKDSQTRDGLSYACRPCLRVSDREKYNRNPELGRARVAAYKKRHPARRYERDLRQKYGLSPDGYEALVASQGGHCAICPITPAENGRNKGRLCVDHDHSTGVVRGLLCDTHNRAIGLLNDDPEMLEKAIRYLKGERIYVQLAA
jgi:hypothetical protein